MPGNEPVTFEVITMPTFPFMQVDAFTTRRLGGNPCAIVFDCPGLSDATMLAIAAAIIAK